MKQKQREIKKTDEWDNTQTILNNTVIHLSASTRVLITRSKFRDDDNGTEENNSDSELHSQTTTSLADHSCVSRATE